MKILSILIVFGFVFPSFSARAELQPLLGSRWAASHPGLLPYEKCELEGHSIDMLFTTVLGVTQASPGGPYYLKCASKKLNLAYKIPVLLDNLVNVRINIAGLVFDEFPTKISVKGLKGNKLENFIGKYKGMTVGGGPFFGGFGRFLSNEFGIKLRTRGWEVGSIVRLEGSRANTRINTRLEPLECKDPYILINGSTNTPRSEDPCHSETVYTSSGPVTQTIGIDPEGLMSLEFVKIQ